MRILFIDSCHPLLHEELERAGHTCDLFYDLSKEEIEKSIVQYDGVVIRSKIKLTKDILDEAANLKFIARVGAGMENIDVEYALKKGIHCFHAPEGNRDAVADHALGMLLALFRNICKANAEVREGTWLREENRGEELWGKTVGIIGYGNTGSTFAKRLRGFDVTVLAYDKYKKGFRDEYVQEVQMDRIFSESDTVSIHLPLTTETEFLVSDAFINKFSKNIYLINTARGKCLHTDDLVKNIKSGKVKGACLDVLEYESVSFEKIEKEKLPGAFQFLVKSDKVILSPHIAGWTFQSNEKMAHTLAAKIKNAFP